MGQVCSSLATTAKNYVYLTHTTKPHPAEKPDPSGKCHLLSLPAELRNVIYRLVLVEEEHIDMVRFVDVSYLDQSTDMVQEAIVIRNAGDPSLTLTCRAISQENLNIYYGENIFRSEPIDITSGVGILERQDVMQWLHWLGDERRGLLKDVEIVIGRQRHHYHVQEISKRVSRKAIKSIEAWLEEQAPEMEIGIVSFVKHGDTSDKLWDELFDGEDEDQDDQSAEEGNDVGNAEQADESENEEENQQ